MSTPSIPPWAAQRQNFGLPTGPPRHKPIRTSVSVPVSHYA